MAEHKPKKKESSYNWYIIAVCAVIIAAWLANFIMQMYDSSSLSTRAGLLGNTAFFSLETFFLILLLAPGVTGLYAEIKASNCMVTVTFWLASIAVGLLFLRTILYFAVIVYTMSEPSIESSCLDSPTGCVCNNNTVWAGMFDKEASPMPCSYAQNVVNRMILSLSINTINWLALLMLVILTCCSKPK